MASRMERYYKNQREKVSRSNKNKNLYNDIYSYGKYSNIEGVASIDKENEVDITKVKKMLESREKYHSERGYEKPYRQTTTKDELPVVRKRYVSDPDRNYDIRDILNKAREKKTPDDKERVLRGINYDTFNDLDKKSDYDEKEDLKELIETITNTSMLNKIGDEDLMSDLMSDLNDDKVSDADDIKDIVVSEKKKEQTMDDSFFTSSLKLNKSDFVDGEESGKSNVFMTIIIVILMVAIAISLAIVVLNKF